MLDGGRAGPFHWRALSSSANLSGARIATSFFCLARSSIFFVLRFGFMHGMFGAAVGSAGAAF
jgi:hypothetical protein